MAGSRQLAWWGAVIVLMAESAGACSSQTPSLRTQLEVSHEQAQLVAMLEPHPIRFSPGSLELRSSARGSLDTLAAALRELPSVTLHIEGFSYSQPDARLNRELSVHRAEAVRLYLVLRGVPAERLGASGHGSAQLEGHDDAFARELQAPQIVFRVAGQ